MIEAVFSPSDIENIDQAVFDWVDERLNIFATTNEGWRKVPVVFATPERSWMSKADKSAHDEKYTLKWPIISVKRGNIARPKDKPGALKGSYLGNGLFSGSLTIAKKISHSKTSERANLDSLRFNTILNSPIIKTKRIVFDIYKIPFPTFVSLTYEVAIKSNFQQQMNEMLSPFIKFAKNAPMFKLLQNGHSYEVKMPENFADASNLANMEADERKVEYSFTFDVLGYLMHGDSNDVGPAVTITQNPAEIVIKTEFEFTGSWDDI